MTRHEMPAFDGHNDVLSRLHAMHPDDPAAAFIKGYDAAIDLEKARSGGFAGGFFAIYVPPIEVDARGTARSDGTIRLRPAAAART